jgi:hypothetical protein
MIVWLLILLLVIIGFWMAKTLVWAVIIGIVVLLALSGSSSPQYGGGPVPWWNWGRGWGRGPGWGWTSGTAGPGGWGNDWSWGNPFITYSRAGPGPWGPHRPRHIRYI